MQQDQDPALKIQEHPQNTTSKPGERVEFLVQTDPIARSYMWYHQEVEISTNDPHYVGPASHLLLIKKCLPKHKGAYKCLVTDTSGKSYFSRSAMLKIGKTACM